MGPLRKEVQIRRVMAFTGWILKCGGEGESFLCGLICSGVNNVAIAVFVLRG